MKDWTISPSTDPFRAKRPSWSDHGEFFFSLQDCVHHTIMMHGLITVVVLYYIIRRDCRVFSQFLTTLMLLSFPFYLPIQHHSPMGRRCSSIHDPRVMGGEPSWLPLTETQGNSMGTDINVEGLHQKRLHTVLFGNPFGEQFSVDFDDWSDLYKLVTNTTSSNKRRRRSSEINNNALSEVHKLSIALQMRGGHEFMYKYSPRHIIFSELCMVLQTRAFCLEKKTGQAVPIALSKFKAKNDKHVLVREIAFGPDADPTVRGVSLWFNVPNEKVQDCNPEVAKRFRWKKQSKGDDSSNRSSKKSSVFDSRECFFMIRPTEKCAFDLATAILQHRYDTLKAERLASVKERFLMLDHLKKEEAAMQKTFTNHKRHWIAWTYPVHSGRQHLDEDAPVPPVDPLYDPITDTEAVHHRHEHSQQGGRDHAPAEVVVGGATRRIWESFTSTMKILGDETVVPPPAPSVSHSRLPIFVRLSMGKPICADRSLPHITKSHIVVEERKQHERPKKSYAKQSERCWRSILVATKDDSGGSADDAPNDWGEVMEHFFKAKSKKVLRFVQQ